MPGPWPAAPRPGSSCPLPPTWDASFGKGALQGWAFVDDNDIAESACSQGIQAPGAAFPAPKGVDTRRRRLGSRSLLLGMRCSLLQLASHGSFQDTGSKVGQKRHKMSHLFADIIM